MLACVHIAMFINVQRLIFIQYRGVKMVGGMKMVGGHEDGRGCEDGRGREDGRGA